MQVQPLKGRAARCPAVQLPENQGLGFHKHRVPLGTSFLQGEVTGIRILRVLLQTPDGGATPRQCTPLPASANRTPKGVLSPSPSVWTQQAVTRTCLQGSWRRIPSSSERTCLLGSVGGLVQLSWFLLCPLCLAEGGAPCWDSGQDTIQGCGLPSPASHRS